MLSSTSRFGVPWVALLIRATLAIIIIFVGAPTWLIAATNTQNKPLSARPYRAPTVFIYLGLFWIASTY